MTERIHEAALSRPLSLAEVPPDGLDIEIVATKRELAALAVLNSLPDVSSFEAKLRARRWRGNGLEIDGELRARMRQTCVVTLEEFESEIAEPIHLRFAPPQEELHARPRRDAAKDGHASELRAHDLLGEDPPDPLIGGVVDLGPVVAEFLTLALDPYPRKPGAEFVEPTAAVLGESASPFAKLLTAGAGKPRVRKE